MSPFLPLVFLLVQGLLLLLGPKVAPAAAYGAMVAAPLAGAAACASRARRERGPARSGWLILGTSLAIWSLGAFTNFWHEWVLGHANEMYRDSMLAFNLSAVPITFLLATEWRPSGRASVRWIDATLALALVYGYFLVTWAMLTARGAPDDAGVQAMVWLLDVQNLCLAIGAVVRWRAATGDDERALFFALAAYLIVYALLIVLNNHGFAGDAGFGPEASSIITLAFAVPWTLAVSRAALPDRRRPPPVLVRVVRSASPALLAGALLCVALFLIRADYPAGVVGVLIAVGGYGLRNTLSQVRSIERGDTLLRTSVQLRNLAWTDALTGLANRHALDAALGELSRRGSAPAAAVAVLMIDIDEFKPYNDRHGHPVGDLCLQRVARALQEALARPGDLLARYGGEEFIVLLKDSSAEGARVVSERLRTAVEALGLPHPDSRFGVVTVSVGSAASSIAPGASPAGLLEAADHALYASKSSGRNQVSVAA